MDEEGNGNIFSFMYIDLVSLLNSPSCSYVFCIDVAEML